MSKYYIGLIPDQHLTTSCNELKNQAQQLFGCTHAKRSPAHITIVPPFAASRQQLALMQNLLSKIAPNYAPFELELSGWNHFKDKTIYLAIKNSLELTRLFDECYDYLIQLITSKNNKQFVPHISIINRDLATDRFAAAFKHFSQAELPATAVFEQLVIFEQSTEGWQERRSYRLGLGLDRPA